jgi:rubrerythrin
MSAKQVHALKKEEMAGRELREPLEAHHRMPDGKLVAVVQICVRCGKTFMPTQGRTRCPFCLDHLKSRAIVLRIP